MALLIASGLRREIAGSPLFEGVSFSIERRDRVALAGLNGAGKTTLLRLLAGELDAHGGELVLEKGARVALHDQRPPTLSELSLEEYVMQGAGGLLAENELRRLEQAMENGDHASVTLRAYSEAQARLEHAGGYAWRERVSSVVRGVGFPSTELGRPLSTFSGGELTRATLARALAGDPDVLLLDEPTNHLDLASLEWLEQELASLDAAVVIVAHDRWFLEATTTAVLELEGGRSTFFPGPWHRWRAEKAARASALAKTAERETEEIERLERFVARFRYGTKARQAQAKLKRIERIRDEQVAIPQGRRTLAFEFAKPARTGRTVLEVEQLRIAAGERALLSDVSFVLERGERVGLVGPNGSGKTTLLETILGRREPASGMARLGYGVEPAYFGQHESFAAASPGTTLREHGTVLQAVQAETGLQRPQAQALLGRFLFSGWERHEAPVTALSGGERRRLALALVVASGANLLVLDEPTNHLDLESREALEAALEAFPGTVLLVSHDRALLAAVATRILAVEERTIRSYDGGWAEFMRCREEPAEAPAPDPPLGRKQKSVVEPRRPAGPSELERVEAEIAVHEERLAELERSLAEDWSDVDIIARHRQARAGLQTLLARWEKLFEEAQA